MSALVSKLDRVRQTEETTSSDIVSLNTSFLLFSHSLEDLAGAVVPSLESSMAYHVIDTKGLPISPGVPGTYQRGIEALSKSLCEAFQSVSAFAKDVKSGVDHLTRPEIDDCKEMADAVSKATNDATTIENLLAVMIPTLGAKSEGYAKKIAKALDKPKGRTDKLKKVMKDVVETRAKLTGSRASLIAKANQSLQMFTCNVQKVHVSCEKRVTAMTNTFTVVREKYSALASKLRECGSTLKQKAEEIDFNSDFSEFVRATKIIRYDLQCLPFESIDLSHPAFADIDTKINVAVPPIYPVGLARVLHSHAAQDERELTCTKGKYMLLMEKPEDEWVFVMNPLTSVMGYVPSSYIEEVGNQLAVVLKTPEAGVLEEGVRTQQGDYVALVGTAGDKWLVTTTKGMTTAFPKDLVGVIYT